MTLADECAARVHDRARQAAARLRAVVAVHGNDSLADWLDEQAATTAPPRTAADDQEDHDA